MCLKGLFDENVTNILCVAAGIEVLKLRDF